MKKIITLFSLGLLGGLITLLGGLVGKVEFSVLLFRSFFAVVICIIVFFVLFRLLTKNLFPDMDFFVPDSVVKTDLVVEQEKKMAKPDNNETSEEDAASGRHRQGSDSLAAQRIAQEHSQQRADNIESQLRNADSKDLANLVRHSLNEES